MQNITNIGLNEKLKFSYLFTSGLVILEIASIILLGTRGLYIALAGCLSLVVMPVMYNKPRSLFLFALLLFPFTRILPFGDKFVVTGILYTLAMPATIWLIQKSFGNAAKKSYYLWGMLTYAGVILLNFLRPETGLPDLVKEFGRCLFSIFTVLALYNYIENEGLDNSIKKLSKLCNYISYTINTIALITIGQYFLKFGGLSIEGVYRARGTFFNFNECAYVLSIFICFALYLFLTSNSLTQKFYWMASILLNMAAIVVTFSKTSIINTVVIFIIMSMFLPFKRRLQLIGGGVLIGALFSVFLITTGAINTVLLRFHDTHSLNWRYGMWRTMESMIWQGNIWLGQGINASKNFLALITPLGDSNAPHNVYLETTFNLGVIGFIAFILVFLFLIYQGLQMFFDKSCANNQNKIIGVTFLTITIITMIQNFVSNAYYDRAANVILWSILTILVCWYNHYRSISIVKKL